MDEMSRAFFAVIGLVVMCGLCSAAVAFGACVICRWMGWAPINIIVNIKNGEADQ